MMCIRRWQAARQVGQGNKLILQRPEKPSARVASRHISHSGSGPAIPEFEEKAESLWETEGSGGGGDGDARYSFSAQL